MRQICKSFPGVKALQNVDFTLRKGEIHALMGENGAGKSTLIKVLTGVYSRDAGTVNIEGVEGDVAIRSPQDAQAVGISTVYQEITLCPNLTVAENIFIARDKGPFINWRAREKRADEILQSLGIPARAKQQLGNCSLAVQQMIAIARAVDMDCKVLILDEPTSSLDEKEVEMLFGLMRDLKARGVGIVFVTQPDAVPVYEAEGLSSAAGVRPYDFRIEKGEVNGFTGLLGSGRSESVRAIFGADHVTGGKVKVNGKSVKITKPIDAMKNGIGYLPEDRKYDGIIADLSVRENIILALQVLKGFFKPISRADAEKFADEYIKALEIKTASSDTPIKSLSGGNQQKVILARWLLTHPQYLILDEPTRGIDVGTKTEIQKLVLKLAEEGVSVTFISSEIEEMLRTCSRLIVMRDRHIVGELTGGELTQENVMRTIAGGGN